MGLFGKQKSKSFLGIDLGSSSIKVVEFENKKGRPVLLTYGYAEFSSTEAGETLFEQTKRTGELLAQVCKQAGVRSTQAMAALPTSKVFTTILSLADGKDQRQRQLAVDAEITKLAPLPLSEMITQTTSLDEEKNAKKDQKKHKGATQTPEAPKQKQFRVLVTGAAKTFIQKYIEIFKTAKLNLQAIDTESLALVRALIGKDKGAIMILDIGSKRTNIIIVEKGIPFVSRSINIGGNSITSELMRQMSLSEEDAERMKRDLGTVSPGDSSSEGLPKLLELMMLPLVNEIRFAFQLYANMELAQIKKVEKIVVTGGSAHLPKIPEYLAHVLNLNVYRGDPWARVVYPNELAGVLEEIGPRMSVAIGLAMREME